MSDISKLPREATGSRIDRDEHGDIEDEYFCPKALKVQVLASTFPTLADLNSIDPWDAERLAQETLPCVCSGARQAIIFVLSVWNPNTPEYYGLKRFDLHEALFAWDREHRQAFAQWARNPWWV